MPRGIMWLIGSLLLATWAIAAATPGRAAPNTGVVLDLTVTTTPPTPTQSTGGTPTQTPPPPGTPTATTPPGTPSATPKRDNEPDPSPTPTATPPPTGDPRIDKSADPSAGFPGDKIDFTIVVRNDSPIPATNVEVEDSVPSQFEIQGATTSQGTIDVSGQRIHAVIGTLPPGGSATIRISTVIRADAAPGQVDNVTIMTSDTPGDDAGNNTSITTVTIQGPGDPTPTPLVPARLPPTSGLGPSLAPFALAALAALLAGLGLRARRRIG